VQRFIAADFEQHYFTLREDPKHHEHLKRICAFDLIANNADRKSGHCLLGEDGRIWGIDNGLCFNVEPKLRTVMWDFAGQALPEALLPDLARIAACPPPALAPLLDAGEVEAVALRAAAALRLGVFPAPGSSHHAYPWPLV
jgi:uncharacterized repeat protein (TIGR03843 family)